MSAGYYALGALAKVKYKPGWWLEWKQLGEHCHIRWAFMAPCAVNGGKPVAQYGRWWYIAGDCTADSALKTALKAALACEEHEAMEHFLFDGKRVFDPHKAVA